MSLPHLPHLPNDNLTPWRPWQTLKAMPHVGIDYSADLPEGLHGACVIHPDGRVAIALDANLGQSERCWTLAHELVHIERGGGCQTIPGNQLWGSMVAKEEAAVNAIACDRLIPPRLLAVEVERALTLDEDPPIEDLADRFWVPTTVVRLALHRLKTIHRTLVFPTH